MTHHRCCSEWHGPLQHSVLPPTAAMWAQGLSPSMGALALHLSSLLSGRQAWDGQHSCLGRTAKPAELPWSMSGDQSCTGRKARQDSSAFRCDPGCCLSGGDSSHKGLLCPQLPLAGTALSSLQKGTMGHCAEQKRAPCSGIQLSGLSWLHAPSLDLPRVGEASGRVCWELASSADQVSCWVCLPRRLSGTGSSTGHTGQSSGQGVAGR